MPEVSLMLPLCETLKINVNELGEVVNIKRETEKIKRTNTNFWDGIGSECLGVTALPQWGGYLPTEDKLRLLGDLTGKSVLEIGCGNGRSIKYV